MRAALPPAAPVAAADHQGTEFWLAFPLNEAGADDLVLYITSDVNTSGTVTIAGVSYTKSFAVTADTITVIDDIPLTAEITYAEFDLEDVNKGVHITAADPIVVYALSHRTLASGYSADAYLGLPVDALGTDYVVLAYETDSYASNPGSMFTLVATQDNTTIDITPTADTWNGSVGRLAGEPYQITLDQGETYMLLADQWDYDDLSGSEISADKPIAVFGGNRATHVPTGYESADFLVEQLPPTSAPAWGKEYVSMPLATRSDGDTFRIIASQDDTEIWIDGTEFPVTFVRGAYYEIVLTAASHITATKPVLVAQYSNGQDHDASANADPFMMLLTPGLQWQHAYVVHTPGTLFPINYLNVIAPAGTTVTLDGVPLSDFTAIGSDYIGKQVAVSDGARHLVVSGGPYLGSVAPDSEPDAQADANAAGDDANGDDEDGVTRTAGQSGYWTNGTVSGGGAVSLTLSGDSACVGAFMDFNDSGTLSAITLRDSDGNVVVQPLATGAHTLYFDVPVGTFPGSGPDVSIYSLFRVTSPVGGVCTDSPAFEATGYALDGEVESYRWNFTPTAVEMRGLAARGGLWGIGAVSVLAVGLVLFRRRKRA